MKIWTGIYISARTAHVEKPKTKYIYFIAAYIKKNAFNYKNTSWHLNRNNKLQDLNILFNSSKYNELYRKFIKNEPEIMMLIFTASY